MDKYLQFNHIELSEEPSFIKWSNGSPSDGNQDWDQWLKDHPEMKDTVSQASRIVKSMQFAHVEIPENKEADIWSKINSDINTVSKPVVKEVKKGKIYSLVPYAAAAAVAIILVMFTISSDFDTTVKTQLAMTKNIELPDGSAVMLNADSKVQFDKDTWDKNRKIALDGEAFFSVKKGSKFTVTTENGNVQVLGTSFNVFSRNDQFNVLCETGKVSVVSSGKETILTPNQAVNVKNSIHIPNRNVEVSERRSQWQEGIFIYKGAALETVAQEVQRQFNVSINMANEISEMTYTGSFNKSDLEKALSEVFWPLGLKTNIKDKNIYVTK